MANPRSVMSCALVLCALFLSSSHVAAEPQNGWWWNTNESGRGYFIEMNGGVFYLAGYFYDNNGSATWMSASGAVADAYSISGTLQSYRNGQSMFGTYRRPDAAVDVGTISITFFDDTHGTLTWPGGTVRIERQSFGDSPDIPELLLNPLTPEFRPKTGWWWNAAESGSGYSVEVQSNTLFVVAFMYDESGNPIWYLTAGAMDSPTHFEGDWLEYSGGQTMSGPYRAPASRNLGGVTIDFAAFDDATITFTERAASERRAKSARTANSAKIAQRSSRMSPQLETLNWSDNDYWPYFHCIIGITTETRTSNESANGVYTSNSFTYFDVLLKRLERAPGYLVDGANSQWSYSFDSTDTHNGCMEHASKENMTSLAGSLTISPDLHVAGRISDKFGGTELIITTDSCQNVQEQPLPRNTHVDGFLKLKYGNTLVDANPFPRTPAPHFRYVDAHKELDDGSEPDDPSAPLATDGKDGLRIKTTAICTARANP